MGESNMNIQDQEILLEIVQGDHLQKDVQKLRDLAYVAGLLIELKVKDGRSFLSVKYNDEFTEFIRSRKAGRLRKKETDQFTCGEVITLKETQGANVAAAILKIPISTFYRRYNENKGKEEGEPFI